MAEYMTQYQQLSVYDEDEEETGDEMDNPTAEADLMIHVVPEGNKGTKRVFLFFFLILYFYV